MQNVTCRKCGWVHFAVTREYAENQVAEFNKFYHASTPETREMHGNHESTIKGYEYCNRCGGPWTNFRPAKDEDCPIGCTIGPIIQEPSS